MLAAEGSVQVAATPREVLEFVCDLRAYMALDGKIVNVYENPSIDSDGNGFAVIRGYQGLLRPAGRRATAAPARPPATHPHQEPADPGRRLEGLHRRGRGVARQPQRLRNGQGLAPMRIRRRRPASAARAASRAQAAIIRNPAV